MYRHLGLAQAVLDRANLHFHVPAKTPIAQLQLRQNPTLEASQREQLMAFLERHIGWNAVKADLYEMYMQTFTEEELKTINDFYITTTGQKVIVIVPQLVQERNRLAMQRLQQNIGELQAIMSADQPHQ